MEKPIKRFWKMKPEQKFGIKALDKASIKSFDQKLNFFKSQGVFRTAISNLAFPLHPCTFMQLKIPFQVL